MALQRFMVQLLLLWQIVQIIGVAKFTNMECTSKDSNFAFTVCRLHAVKRDVVEMSLQAKIIQFPKQPIAMRLQLLKRASGYKPFLYDISHSDLCDYLEKRNHPFVNIVLNSFANYTDVSKCPFPSEVRVEHFRFPIKSLEKMPLPDGDYAVFATFSLDQRELVLLKVFFTLTEFR